MAMAGSFPSAFLGLSKSWKLFYISGEHTFCRILPEDEGV